MKKANKYTKIRISLGLSRKDFCKKADINLNTWIKLETYPETKLQSKTISKLVNNCNVNLEYLLGNSLQIFINIDK